MNQDDFVLELRDAARVRKGQFRQKDMTDVSITPTMNDVGVWEVELPGFETDSLGRKIPNIACQSLRTPGWGIVASGPGGTLLSGPMVEAEWKGSKDEVNGVWKLSGISDLHWAMDAMSYPNPASYSGAGQSLASDVRTGPVETLLHAYFNANIGPGGVVERRVPGLTMGANLGRGPVKTITPDRWQNLLELFQSMVIGTDIRFDIVQADVGTGLQFRTWVATDLTNKIRMDYENSQLDEAKYSYSAPEVTEIMVGGKEAEDESYPIYRATGNAGWGRRIETFISESQAETSGELIAKGNERLAEAAAEQNTFEAVPNTDLRYVLGVDYQIGDMVTVIIEGDEVAVPVTSAPISYTPEGLIVGATLGTSTGNEWADFVDARQSNIERRVAKLERK